MYQTIRPLIFYYKFTYMSTPFACYDCNFTRIVLSTVERELFENVHFFIVYSAGSIASRQEPFSEIPSADSNGLWIIVSENPHEGKECLHSNLTPSPSGLPTKMKRNNRSNVHVGKDNYRIGDMGNEVSNKLEEDIFTYRKQMTDKKERFIKYCINKWEDRV